MTYPVIERTWLSCCSNFGADSPYKMCCMYGLVLARENFEVLKIRMERAKHRVEAERCILKSIENKES